MATNTPKFQGPDGVYRENYVFTTDRSDRFFNGSMSVDTADMQVSIRGAAFTSDPDLIYFEGTSFIIPNPSAYPQGLRLLSGPNRIEVKSVLTSGAVTAVGVIQANLALDRDTRAAVLAPSGVYIERFDQRVKITVDGIDDDDVVGYNFYASTSPGGGTVGYTQINVSMVMTGDQTATYSNLGSLTVDATVASNPDGTHKADPQYMRIVGTQVDRNGTVLQTDFDQVLGIPETTSQIRTQFVAQDVQYTTKYSFMHDRRSTEASSDYPAIPNSDFNAIPDTDPLYYVVTAVYLIDGKEYESSLSPELAAAPMIVTPAIALLPTVTRQQIVRDTALSIYRSHPEVDIKPGSVLRDTVIDPFSTEAERLRFIVGFIQAAQATATLLAIDDPGNTGESLPVVQSEYKLALKQAFFLQDDTSVQNMIDNMFDHLAARRGVTRNQGNRAQGEVTLYVTTRPTTDITIPIGTEVVAGGSTFRTTSLAIISTTGGLSFYNPTTGQYYTRAFIQATDSGSAGNVSAGQIRTINNAPNGVQVVNESSTFGGSDVESNRDLAARSDGVLSAVDSGTYRGLTQTAIEVPGVRQVNVVDAGHALMMRDYDTTLGKHTGGKADVWIRGDNYATVSDSFAFTFDMVINGQFEPVGDVANMKFRAINTALSDDNPIIEMLYYPTLGYTFRDDTTGQVFDLTGATLIAPDQVQLSPTYNDPSHLQYTDVFTGTYRYRTGGTHTFTRQPVDDISSFVGEVSGTIPATDYKLFHASDPLDLGRSTEAGDYMALVQDPGTDPTTSLPSGDPIVVTDEHHVFLGGTEYLGSLGIQPLTIHIWNTDKTIEYRGPYTPTALGAKDFTLVDETGETPMGFRATSTARFADGDEVLVSYNHDEVFTVTYTTNSLVALTQQAIDADRHVTADVLAKDAIPVGVDIKATVVLSRSQVVTTVDGAIRTNLARLFGGVTLGQPVRQSDIIATIDNTDGVSYVVSPLTLLCKSDGSQVVREFLLTEIDGTDYTLIPSWSSATVKVYLITQQLSAGTTDGGGEINDFRSVFQGAIPLTLYWAPPDVYGSPIKTAVNSAFIIGNDGLTIPGVALDDTKRRVLIALGPDETPADAEYYVTYVVYDDDGVKNISVGPTEYLELGDLEFTYDEDTDFEALVRGRRTM